MRWLERGGRDGGVGFGIVGEDAARFNERDSKEKEMLSWGFAEFLKAGADFIESADGEKKFVVHDCSFF